MKKVLFLLIINTWFFTNLFAQLKSNKLVDDKQVLAVDLSDTLNRQIFNKNSNIRYISIAYKHERPYYVFFRFEDAGNKSRREHYDLEFEGDAYLLKYKYGPIHLVNPTIKIQSIWNEVNSGTTFTIRSAVIENDTVSYRFSQKWPDMDVKPSNPEGIVGMPARYKGNLELIETKLARELSEMKNKMGIDSIVVFRATVSKQGVLSAMELIGGKQSLLSNLVQQAFTPKKDEFGLLPPSEDWYPAGIDRGAIETKIRIYARLNSDGSVTIKTPRRLRTFTGE